jgi:hypothetical protein
LLPRRRDPAAGDLWEADVKAQGFISAVLAVMVAVFALLPGRALAVPLFARQTGLECSACHIGSFGPQLTNTGRLFKATGYTMGEKKKLADYAAAMIIAGNERTRTDVPDPDMGKPNNNSTVDQVSLFAGGRITDHLGAMAQVTYDPNAKVLALDNTDVRYANTATLGGKPLIWGVSVNNNPSMQDLWNTTPAWGFPYVASALAPAPATDSFMSGQGGAVIGAGAYGLYDNWLYAEYSRYYNIPDGIQRRIGNGDVSGNDHLTAAGAAYWRLAVQHGFGDHYVEAGTFGLAANRYPGNNRDNGNDYILDSAIDASYQYTPGGSKHIVTANITWLHERQNLRASFAAGGADNPSDTLDSVKANLSYYYDNTYGVTVGRFDTRGSADATLYGTPNGRPDSAGYITQFDVTPLGRSGRWAYPYVNIRLFVQLTTYTKFDGLKINYDGMGRNASDNNTIFFGIWSAF